MAYHHQLVEELSLAMKEFKSKIHIVLKSIGTNNISNL